jgi:hypothetical protein
MDISSIPAWVSVPAAIVTALSACAAIVVTIWKAPFEVRTLHGSNLKELLNLIAELESRGGKRDPDSAPAQGLFENPVILGLLASQVFRRPITWSDWQGIQRFTLEHNVPLDTLRRAWPYRDERKAPSVRFQMTADLCVLKTGYYVLASCLSFLIAVSVAVAARVPSSAGQLYPVGAVLLLLFFLHVHIVNRDLLAALRLCKKTKSITKASLATRIRRVFYRLVLGRRVPSPRWRN